MNLLAVETSGRHCAAALICGDVPVAEQTPRSDSGRHAQMLVADIDVLLSSRQLLPSDIDVVAVSIGPGSFTGLRVGLVFAKTFAWINAAKLVAVDTLQAIAQQAPNDIPLVTSIIDAQRGEVFAADYRWNSQTGLREPVSEIRIVRPEQLDPHNMLCGPALEKTASVVSSSRVVAPPECWAPRPSTIGFLAQAKSANGHYADPVTLEPIYVRRSYAEEKQATP